MTAAPAALDVPLSAPERPADPDVDRSCVDRIRTDIHPGIAVITTALPLVFLAPNVTTARPSIPATLAPTATIPTAVPTFAPTQRPVLPTPPTPVPSIPPPLGC